MPVQNTTPNAQIFNDGACIRIQKGEKTLLVTKEQVKTIDTVHDNIVRIDIGEGPLKNIFLNYQEVAVPLVASAEDLRDQIKAMLLSDIYEGGDAKEVTQLSILNQLSNVASILQAIKLNETDLTKTDPSRVDESNPYMIYQGWHSQTGIPDANEWAIRRIRREDDQIIHEWAFGTKKAIYPWNVREQHYYVPYDFIGYSESPLPNDDMTIQSGE